ncbi:hypothetical protein DRJ48_04800 [Candidatus Woesearchaeota archaeon]|nr:type II secretion system F family protein [Candidatus Woesearchaeota archaeon]RLE41824.1 MAG: hypothetical protein DRJ48_04800 [Candidatus Woesearchaeota archaeon]
MKMRLKVIFLEEFGKAFIPKRFRPYLRNYLLKAGVSEVPYKLYGGFFYLSLVVTYIVYILLVYPALRGRSLIEVLLYSFGSWVGIQLGVIFAIGLIYYLYMEQRIYIRTQKMEEVLDEFLHIVSENIKGGMTLEEAFWNAVKPEFGVLSSEIRLAAKKVMTGEDVTDALREFTSKYNSPMLTRSFNLIIQSIEGGGRISDIIDRVIRNIVETKRLKKEMAATNLTYVIFVSFVVIAVAPALFTLSNQFLRILGEFSPTVGGLEGPTNLPLNLGRISINPVIFQRFSIYAIATISIFASMIISIIRKGSIRAGVKLIPVYLSLSFLMYSLFSKVADIIVRTYFGL